MRQTNTTPRKKSILYLIFKKKTMMRRENIILRIGGAIITFPMEIYVKIDNLALRFLTLPFLFFSIIITASISSPFILIGLIIEIPFDRFDK